MADIVADTLVSHPFFTLSWDMFFVVGLDGYIKHINPVCQKILLYPTEEFLASPFVEFIHPQDREYTTSQLIKIALGRDGINFENRYRCRDGSYKWLLWNANFCRETQLIYAVARDITQRKRAEAALKESDERFRLLIDSVKDYAIYMLDEIGCVVSWNQGAERFNGYQAEEILGKHYSCLFSPEDIQSGKPEQLLEIAAANGRFEDETRRLRKDGSEFWGNIVVTALRDEENGKLRGYAIVTRDITERRRANEALQHSKDELEKRVQERTAELQATNQKLKREIKQRTVTEAALRKSKARLRDKTRLLEATLQELQMTQAHLIQQEKMSSLGQLVAGVAHEINNPVSFIYCNIEFANRYSQDLMNLLQLYTKYYSQPEPEIQSLIDAIDLDFVMEDMPKMLSSMKIGAERIQQIVLSLKNFSRHDQVEKKFINIHEGIDSTLLILQNRLKSSSGHPGIKVIKEYGDIPAVECFGGQLNQVFMNILSNAIDALEEQGIGGWGLGIRKLSPSPIPNHQSPIPMIRICTQVKDNGYVVIRIADNGLGMSEQVCRSLFDPFFTTKPPGKGTGLGLWISYEIVVQRHGGKLTCISEPGKGAEFVIEIPIGKQLQFPCAEVSIIPAAS
jgi:PAS domain S-box-containing protein